MYLRVAVLLRIVWILVLFYLCTVKYEKSTFHHRFSSDTSGEIVLDDLHLFVGEECSG